MSKETLKSGLTVRAIAVATIIALLYTIPLVWWMQYQSARFVYRRLSPMAMHLVFLTFIATITALITRKSLSKAFSPQELTVIFSILAAAIPVPWALGMTNFSLRLAPLKTGDYPGVWEVVPEFWLPKALGVDVLWNGGIGLSEFFPSILLWTIIIAATYILSYSIGLLLRKPFLEVEKLPYPLVTPASFVVENSTTTEREGGLPKILKAKLFWAAFLIGFVYMFIYSWQGFGLFETIGLSRPTPPLEPYVNIPGKLPSPFTNAVISWEIDTLGIGLYMLFPLDILLTGVIFGVLGYIIWPAIQVSTGLVKAQPGAGEWGLYGLANSVDIFVPEALLDIGSYIGIGLLSLWIARKPLIESVRHAIKGTGDEKPFSYRILWMLIVTTAIILIGFLAASGVDIFSSIVTIALLSFTMFVLVRVRGEVWPGYPNAWCCWQGSVLSNPLYPIPVVQMARATGAPVSPDVARSIYVTTGFLATTSWYGVWTPAIASVESLKLAEETGTDYRDVVIVGLPVAILVIFLTVLFLSMNVAQFGAKTFLADWWTGGQFAWMGNTETAAALRSGLTPLSMGRIAWTIIGVLVAIGLGLARMRIPGFPLNPLGMPLFSVTFYGLGTGIIAYVIKLLVLKIAGAKAWEEKGLPIALGLFIGGYFGFYPIRVITCFLTGR
jgi:hypothetical protein